MLRYAIRRILFAIPTLLIISLIIFWIIDAAPGDPASQLPLTVPAEIREQMREALGVNDPFFVKWTKWVRLMFINEPLHYFEQFTGTCFGDCEARARIISSSSRSPAVDAILLRLPQTLWIMGTSFILGIFIAVPIGVVSARRQYSWFDNLGTFVSMVGYSVPVFFTGLLAVVIFSVWLNWFPSFYKTNHEIVWTEWSTVWFQIKQMIMPVTVLSFFNAAALARFTRASVLDNLNQDYVRTARSKGLTEQVVVNRHVLRNSLIPVVTLIALSIPGIFTGAIITESIFRINGVGQQLLSSIGQGDIFLTQTITFIFAALTVVFNLVADLLYGFLDPRIRYE